MKKGESLRDTVADDRGDGRRRDRRAPRLGRRAVAASPSGSTPAVINAGDGWHEHPTQALLDCYTIRQRLGVARRQARRHRRRHQAQPGGALATCSPSRRSAPTSRSSRRRRCCRRASTGWPVDGQPRPRRGAAEGRRRLPAAHAARADDRGADPVAARVHDACSGSLRRRVDRLAEHAIVMHPGPMNRGVEIAADVAELPRSVIVDQVRNGVAVRMACCLPTARRRAGSTACGKPASTDGVIGRALVHSRGRPRRSTQSTR